MTVQLNEAQAAAVGEFTQDLLVTAGAGTGKTGVLTNKYLRLLEERRAEVNQIVAITFTKKAAAEMQSRIEAMVLQRLETTVGDVAATDYWQGQLKQLETARINTFHSFCLSLIRQYPLQAGIPPVSRILEEGEIAIYLKQVVENALLHCFQNYPEGVEGLTKILLEFGWEELVTDLGLVYQNIRESGLAFGEAVARGTATLEQALRLNPEQLPDLLEKIRLLMAEAAGGRLTERAQEIMGAFTDNWPRWQNALYSPDLLGEVVPVLQEIKKALPKTLPTLLKKIVVEIHEIVTGLMARILDEEALQRLPIILQLLVEIEAQFTRFKRERGVLDYTDQLVLARNLLRDNPRLRSQVQQEIQYLLVDEFQDTNELQMELVDLLRGEDQGTGRLMAVGDIKQSIYRFRGAEAGLILELGQKMTEQGGRTISLTQNYRSQQQVISFVNQLSQKIFAEESFVYEALEPVLPDSESRVEFICTGTANRELEARVIAHRIKALTAASQNEDKPVDYGDIVLLFRANTSILIYQRALEQAGIPYYTASGGNFYRCQEVADQLNLLQLVANRFDEVALLALLGSPYVGLTNESLLLLGGGQSLGARFYEMKEFPEELEAGEVARLHKFRDLLFYLQTHRSYLPIADMLRIALERSAYREILWTLPNAGQRIANLEKLISKAQNYMEQGFHDVHLFLDYIKKLETVAVLEGEAATQKEAGNAVRLMSIHRSKGLEFEIVFLPDLDRQFLKSIRGKMVFHKKKGLAFTISYGEGEQGVPSHLAEIKELEQQEGVAELKRLLYVALTRAKRQLFLVGSGASRSRGKTLATAGNWMKWFELLLPLDTPDPVIDYQGILVYLSRAVEFPELPETAANLERLWEEVEQAEGQETKQGAIEVAPTKMERFLPVRKTIKVTELVSYAHCPQRYQWEYLWKLKPAEIRSGVANAKAADPDLGARLGRFVHQLFRLTTRQWPQSLWEETFGDLDPQTTAVTLQDVKQMWANFQQSPFGHPQLKVWNEVPFIFKMEPGLKIEGRLDRLQEEADGSLSLVDYKTNRVTPAVAHQLAKEYFWQARLYALAVQEIWGRLPQRAVLYFPYPDESVTVPLGAADLAQVLQKITVYGQELATCQASAPRLWEPEAKCQKCGYAAFCQKVK